MVKRREKRWVLPSYLVPFPFYLVCMVWTRYRTHPHSSISLSIVWIRELTGNRMR